MEHSHLGATQNISYNIMQRCHLVSKVDTVKCSQQSLHMVFFMFKKQILNMDPWEIMGVYRILVLANLESLVGVFISQFI